MADFTKTVDIIFGGRDSASPVVRDLNKNLDNLNTGIQGLASPLAAVADTIIKVDVALAALGVTALGFAIKEGAAWERSINEISTLLELTPEQLSAFEAEITEYAATSTASLESITGAVYNAISAGVDYADSLEVIAAAEKLAIAGNAELDSTLKVLVSSLNAYGAETSRAAEFADALFTGVKFGQTTLDELAGSLARVAPSAAAAGLSFDELVATVAGVTSVGTSTAEAMSAIKAALSNIIKPSKEAQEAAAALGIQFDVGAVKTKGWAGFLDELWVATGGNIETMGKLFGSTEALNAIMVVAGDSSGKFAAALEGMAGKAGTVEVQFAKMADNVNLALENLENNFRLTFKEAGTKILEQFGDDVGALSDVFGALRFAIADGAFDDIFAAINAFGLDLERTLTDVAENLPEALAGVDFSGLLEAFSDLGDAFAGLFDGIDLGTAEGLRDFIQDLVDIGESLVRTTGGMVESFGPLISTLGDMAEGFGNLDKDTLEAIGGLSGIGKQVELLSPILDGGVRAVEGLANAIVLMAGAKVLGGLDGLKTLFTGVGGAMAAGLGPALAMGGAIAAIAVAADDLISGDDTIYNWVRETIPGFDDAATAVFDFVHELVGLETVGDKVEKSLGNITASATGLIERGLEPLHDAHVSAREAADAHNTLLNDAVDAMKAAGIQAARTGDEIKVLGSSTSGVSEDLEEIAPGIYRVKDALDATGEAVPTFTDGIKGIATSYKGTAEAAEEATEKSDEFLTKMEEIASNERIKVIEAGVDLGIAALEADAKKAVAIIDELGTSITATADLLGTLWSTDGPEWDKFGFEIRDQIELENKRRDEQLRLEKALVEEQIKNLRARTEALRSGDSLIKVSADGLEPDLAAIMFKILDRVRLEMVKDAGNLLIG